MSKYLILYKINPATQSENPEVAVKDFEKSVVALTELSKAGIFKEHGVFNAGDGFIIAEFSSFEEALKLSQNFFPGVITKVREYVSWEKASEIVLSSLKEQVEKTN